MAAPAAREHPSVAEACNARGRADSQAPAGSRVVLLAGSSRPGAADADAACPVCGLLLPAAQLQAHIQEELALLVDDGPSWPPAGSPTALGAGGPSRPRAAAAAKDFQSAGRAGPGRSAATAKPTGGCSAAALPRPGVHASSRTGSRAWQPGGVGALCARQTIARVSAHGRRRARSGRVRPVPQSTARECWSVDALHCRACQGTPGAVWET